jgi:hypothetical protein
MELFIKRVIFNLGAKIAKNFGMDKLKFQFPEIQGEKPQKLTCKKNKRDKKFGNISSSCRRNPQLGVVL